MAIEQPATVTAYRRYMKWVKEWIKYWSMSNWNSIQELVGTNSCVCAGFGRVQCMAALSQKLLNIPIGLFSISAVCCLTPDIKFGSSFLKGERSHSSLPVKKKSASKLAILIVKKFFFLLQNKAVVPVAKRMPWKCAKSGVYLHQNCIVTFHDRSI